MQLHFLNQILMHAKLTPEKAALISNQAMISFAGLCLSIAAVEEKLSKAGIQRGDRVGFVIQDRAKEVIMFLALLRAGVTAIPLNRESALAPPLEMSAMLLDIRLGPSFANATLVTDEWFEIRDVRIPEFKPAYFETSEPAVVWFSSGTTGRPKPLAQPWHSLKNYIYNRSIYDGSIDGATCCTLFPIQTVAGATFILSQLASGRRIVLLPKGEELSIFAASEVYEIDRLDLSSFLLDRIVKQAASRNAQLRQIKSVNFTGSGISASLILDAQVYLSRNIHVAYGSTEAGRVTYGPAIDAVRIPGCVGYVGPWAEAEIVDETGSILASGKEGSVRVRTDCMSAPFTGWHSRYDQASFGWSSPGDVGFMTPDNRLVITGRASDIINVGGNKMAPEVIEEVILKHASVSDIAACGRMSDASGIEELHVFLTVTRPSDKAAVTNWCTQNIIHLRSQNIHFVSAIPRTESGKIARAKVKEIPISGGSP